MQLLNVALECIGRGWFVFPCRPKSKEPAVAGGFKAATNDPEKIREWWSRWPDANVGIATGASGLCVLDVDTGLAGEADAQAFLRAAGIGSTYTVRTGRRPGFAMQVYFLGAGLRSAPWKDPENPDIAGDIRCSTGYVMAAGSVHPSGELYAVWDAAELDFTPEYVQKVAAASRELLQVEDDGEPITEWRNDKLTRVAGKMRNAGMSASELDEYIRNRNATRNSPPLPEDEVARIIHNACKWDVPADEPPIILGSNLKKAAEVADNAEDAEIEEGDVEGARKRPAYPDDVWSGTFYGEFADACTNGNFIPKKFFSETLRTVVGAIVGDRIQCPLTGVTMRSYTVKIGQPGCGKGTSDEYVRNFFEAERWEGLRRTENPLLWGSPEDIGWKHRGLGAYRIAPASAPGLIKAIEVPRKKKTEVTNPMAQWHPMPRVITMAEEVRSLFSNFANESTGAGLESVLCELFDRETFTSTATKDRAPASGKLMYSLLGGITKEGWDSVFSKTESTDSGFLSRVTIIGSEESRTTSGLVEPDFESLRRRFLPMIEALEKDPLRLAPSKEAVALVEEWWRPFQARLVEIGVSYARLNIHAWRGALHVAWLRGHRQIEADDAAGGVRLAEYQAKMREYYAPPEGETRAARCDAAIRKIVKAKRRVKVRDLQKATNANRVGVAQWEKSLETLVKAGEVRIEEGVRGSRTVILLKPKG